MNVRLRICEHCALPVKLEAKQCMAERLPGDPVIKARQTGSGKVWVAPGRLGPDPANCHLGLST